MDALRRNQYLQTMGVDVWVSRRAAPLGSAGAPASAAEDLQANAIDAPPRVGISESPRVGAAEAARVAAADVALVGTLVGARPLGEDGGVAAKFTSVPQEGADAGPNVVDARSRRGSSDVVSPSAPAGITTWESLRSEVLACTKCSLHGSRTQGVFGVGSREAQWLVVGEAPGAEEDRRGEPFVGRAGHLLDAMLKAIGLSRGSNVYIANVLKSRPPGNRDPKPEEVAACLPYLMRQIELLRPRVMLAVGRIAAQNLLSTDAPLGRLRGKVHHFGELNTPLIVTYHPAYLLRTPSDKRKAWEDLKFARSVFQGLNPT
jgi:uracil-DNA glycosylase